MRLRLLFVSLLVSAALLSNAAVAGNIAHGVSVVVIDPGHGGRLPGAHYGSIYEKDLVLKVGLRLGKLIEEGMPVLGTCAGLILLAERVIDDDGDGRPIRPESHLGTMCVTVERNAYGRQLASFHATGDFMGIGTVPMSFIRAPRIVDVREGAVELARVNGDIVAARDGNQVGVAFHPELDDDPRIHELFLSL